MAPRVRLLVIVLALAPVAFVAQQAVATLRVLNVIERERDSWQRPDAILMALALEPGQTVVDLGSGAGYFALKIAPRVGPDGHVVAVDLRRQSLAFLWVRARLRGYWTLVVIQGEEANPRLPVGRVVDAVLIANTYHELAEPGAILRTLFTAMRPGARLVVVDRGPRADDASRWEAAAHHEVTAAAAVEAIIRQGFRIVSRDDRFIDRPGDDDVWWLEVFRKP
jgi:predicted methyltransferase